MDKKEKEICSRDLLQEQREQLPSRAFDTFQRWLSDFRRKCPNNSRHVNKKERPGPQDRRRLLAEKRNTVQRQTIPQWQWLETVWLGPIG